MAGLLARMGLRGEVHAQIARMSGLPAAAIEEKATIACEVSVEQSDRPRSPAVIQEDIENLEWLLRMHLVALDRILTDTKQPSTKGAGTNVPGTQGGSQPAGTPSSQTEAKGAFEAFYEIHELITEQLRARHSAMVEKATLEEARAFGAFLEEIVLPHERAEDQVLVPLVKSLRSPMLERALDTLAREHRSITEQIAKYQDVLRAIERSPKKAQLDMLTGMAEDLRMALERHLAKEEESVIRPLQAQLTSEQFQPVVQAIANAVGEWLRMLGWRWPRP